jgi:hypothetical protein
MAGNLTDGHGPFVKQVDRINNLRVTQPIARHPAAFHSHVNAACACALDQSTPALGKSATEVAILKPAIKHEPLVEPQIANRR